MAYFFCGSEGMKLERECASCKYGEDPCPIAWAQLEWNYKACNNEIAREILDYLIDNDGKCKMKEFMKKYDKEA